GERGDALTVITKEERGEERCMAVADQRSEGGSERCPPERTLRREFTDGVPQRRSVCCANLPLAIHGCTCLPHCKKDEERNDESRQAGNHESPAPAIGICNDPPKGETGHGSERYAHCVEPKRRRPFFTRKIVANQRMGGWAATRLADTDADAQ